MARIVAALLAGFLFGAGLAVSQMVNPAKVQNFLDIAGSWDPSLAFVLAGATGTALLGFRLVRRRAGPLFAEGFQLPTASRIDLPLLAGSAIFGIGWGLAGLCPGPAVAGLALAPGRLIAFVLAMLAGMAAFRLQSAWTLRRHGG
ncbi:MAG: DUF6691 family protein [Alphaproteobacteria bacterium]